MKLGFFVPNLLSWSGDELVIGGLERYAWALIDLINDLGWEVEVHQNGNSNWEREVNGVKVIGHGVAQFSPEAVVEEANSCCDKILYGSILQSPMYYKQNSIVISHGVWWDSNNFKQQRKEKMIKLCGNVLNEVDLVISCDYNFLNVMRSIWPGTTDKIRVIPNFVDLEEFKPSKNPTTDSKIRILYPRRLDNCRGTDIFIELANQLISTVDNIEILMAIDRNNPDKNKEIKSFLAQDQVKNFNLQFSEMPAIYQQADIVIIPSKYSEGTSFSCLEAMASGKAIIATDVGGLTNLIIDGYNGILVPPRLKTINKAVNLLINNQEMRQVLGQRARETAKAFTIDRWRQYWAEYLKAIYLK
ncbi:glycosyltransferase family 4 protein [Natroniella sulfidigena]|uniref:glycosyltransferase family 4 protein n=1 Tax=Natroniella sulfidigena TaxID=723921 RepID=UPI00200B108B|nr:glycosyltransferase family 4 protein [Natroniella sulfidigena]MCK8817062.1 glycosyltransferase family 4 protein [Natroniella sulfidigena]